MLLKPTQFFQPSINTIAIRSKKHKFIFINATNEIIQETETYGKTTERLTHCQNKEISFGLG